MTNVLPITREGGLLAKLRYMFGNDAQIQEGDVRVEKVLAANSVSQRFNLNGEGSSKRDLEVFIGLNDLVIPYQLKVFVNKVLDTTKPGNNGNTDDLTYPDLSVFTDAATATAVTDTPPTTPINKLNYSDPQTMTHGNAGSPSVGDRLIIRASRDIADTNTGDLQLAEILILET